MVDLQGSNTHSIDQYHMSASIAAGQVSMKASNIDLTINESPTHQIQT